MARSNRDTKDTSLRLLRVDSHVPEKFKGLIERSAKGENTPTMAIKAKCIECCGFEDVSDRVRHCTTYSCPLHAYRPYQERKKEGVEDV